jgi:hypothetical protein
VKQLLPYLGHAQIVSANSDIKVLRCAADETQKGTGMLIPVSYRANEHVCREDNLVKTPLKAATIPAASEIHVFSEKTSDTWDFSETSSEWETKRVNWNSPNANGRFRYPGIVRHDNGSMMTAADGHGLYLKFPPIGFGSAAPRDLNQLGDSRTGTPRWPRNGRERAFNRELATTAGF